MRDYVGGLDYLQYLLISNSFRDYEINSAILDSVDTTFEETDAPNGETIEEFIINGEDYNLKYIISNEIEGVVHPITDRLYHNHAKYTYLEKIFDSNEYGFKELKIKVFKIDYEKFYQEFPNLE